MSGFIIALIVFALVVVMWFIGESNRLNRYQVMIEESKRTVDITLVKRYDTISEMLKVAKAYAKHEEKVFSELVALRQGASIQESIKLLPIKMMFWHKSEQWVRIIRSSYLLTNSWPCKKKLQTKTKIWQLLNALSIAILAKSTKPL